MSSPQRPDRRLLSFEQLETKTSPSSFVQFGWIGDQDPGLAAEQARQHTGRLLQYVAQTLATINIDRQHPSLAEVSAADEMLGSEPVPSE